MSRTKLARRQRTTMPDSSVRHSHSPHGTELPELDRLIHERIRLGIISALAINPFLPWKLAEVACSTDSDEADRLPPTSVRRPSGLRRV